MKQKYLPINKDNKLYSPIGVQSLFKKAVADEGGKIQSVFDKQDKYKSLIELWYASVLAVAIHKWIGKKFYMYPSDSPDIHFVRTNENEEQEGFSVEIMTLFDYKQKIFDQNYKKLAAHVWKAKGKNDYDRTELLLVSRLTGQINVDKFLVEINKFRWKFLRVWLSAYNGSQKTWTIFEIAPYPETATVGKITVELSDVPY